MAKAANDKTNAMRMLDRAKVAYTVHEYNTDDGLIDAVHSAQKMGLDPAMVYKTLVTRGTGKDFYVFVIPAAEELDLKAAARAVGEKSVAMLHVAELLGITGYIRGGCSPVGMKKLFRTTIDASCLWLEKMAVSGGKIGRMVELRPADLIAATHAQTAEILMHHA